MFPLPETIRCHTVAVVRTEIHDEKIRKCGGMPFISLAFRLSGKAELTVGNVYVCSVENHVTLLPQRTPYTARYEENEMIFVHFSTDVPLYTQFYDRLLRHPEKVCGLLCRLLAVWERQALGFRVEADALLMQILVACARDEHAEDGAYTAACALFRKRYGDTALSVEEVAAAVQVSPSQLRRLFRARCGESPCRYLSELRLSRAAQLLTGGDVTVAETAIQCGFSDARYFTRVFKQRYGVPPSRFRLG